MIYINDKLYFEINVTEADEGQEVLYFLKDVLKLSAAKIKRVKYDDAGILLDGVRVNVRKKVSKGQRLHILAQDEESKDCLIPVPMKINIIFEDEFYLFVNKGPHMVCHPSRGHYADSLANGVRDYFDKTNPGARIHLVGRLDQDTSGIVSIAKSQVAAGRLSELKNSGLFEKRYYAIVNETPPKKCDDITISMQEYIAEEYDMRNRMKRALKDELKNVENVISANGTNASESESGSYKVKKAFTHYEVLREFLIGGKAYSLCDVAIKTGRMHQIRFHMSEIGHPLLGDDLYGDGDRTLIDRCALHAYKLIFEHPFTGEHIELSCDMPNDMKNLII